MDVLQNSTIYNIGSINSFHVALYMGALLLGLTNLVYTLIQKRTDKLQNAFYIVMLCIGIFNSVTELINEMVVSRVLVSKPAFLVYSIDQYLYFLTHGTFALIFLLYELAITGSIRKISDKKMFVYLIPWFILEAVIITNPYTNWLYGYNEANIYVRGPLISLIYILSSVYIFFALASFFIHWRSINERRKAAIIYFFGIVVIGMVIQGLYSDIRCELFGEMIALFGLMVAIESEDDRIDPDTGIYNRKALSMDIENYMTNETEAVMICIRIKNISMISRYTGSSNYDGFISQMTDFLKGLIQKSYIYNVDPEQFVILMPKSRKIGKSAAERLQKKFQPRTTKEELVMNISDRFKRKWDIGKSGVVLDEVLIVVNIPDDVRDMADIFSMVNSSVADTKKRYFEGEDLKYFIRRAAVEKAVVRGLEDHHFEVFYQPTYHLENFKLYGAEALLRLHDPILGEIYPDEFIPIAELAGMISDVDDFVLREVCEFIKTGIPKDRGMECINVNLSVLQCMQQGFVSHITNIVDEYDIDRSFITFEITETVGADDYEHLSEVVEQLKLKGFSFAMDDYGTGYSNIQSSFSINYDEIKIDKSIL